MSMQGERNKIRYVGQVHHDLTTGQRSLTQGEIGESRVGRHEMHAHLVVDLSRLYFMWRLVLERDIKIARVAGVGHTGDLASYVHALRGSDCLWGVEYSLSEAINVNTVVPMMNLITYFQCVYFAWGPVENLTGLWQASKEISNQARNAWMSVA